RRNSDAGDAVDGEDAVGLLQGGEGLVGDGAVGGEHHERGALGARGVDVHRRDGHTGLSQDDTHHTDHPGTVVVADDKHVLGGGDLDGVVVDEDDAGLGSRSGQGAGHGGVGGAKGDQVYV